MSCPLCNLQNHSMLTSRNSEMDDSWPFETKLLYLHQHGTWFCFKLSHFSYLPKDPPLGNLPGLRVNDSSPPIIPIYLLHDIGTTTTRSGLVIISESNVSTVDQLSLPIHMRLSIASCQNQKGDQGINWSAIQLEKPGLTYYYDCKVLQWICRTFDLPKHEKLPHS